MNAPCVIKIACACVVSYTEDQKQPEQPQRMATNERSGEAWREGFNRAGSVVGGMEAPT